MTSTENWMTFKSNMTNHQQTSTENRKDITVTREDNKTFWLHDGGDYKFQRTGNEVRDPRIIRRMWFDFADRTYISDSLNVLPTAMPQEFFALLSHESRIERPEPDNWQFRTEEWAVYPLTKSHMQPPGRTSHGLFIRTNLVIFSESDSWETNELIYPSR
jgi:hypothetical protein